MDDQDPAAESNQEGKQPSIWKWRIRHILVSFVVIGMGVLFLFILGQKYNLACTRVNATQFDCTIKSLWFGLLPAGEQSISHLQSAQVGTSCKGASCTYRVELVLEASTVPLIPGYTPDGEVKQAIAAQINNAIKDSQKQSFSASDGFNTFFLIVPVIFILAGVYILIRRWH
jgi:hypothetical protein